MCTVTWLREQGGYQLLFNRDERKSRAEALPPRAGQTGGVRWIAPVDPDGGGTWLATSQRGLTIGVLNGNRRSDEDATRTWRSRGELAPALIDSRDPAQVATRLSAMDLQEFRSFRLLALAPGSPVLVAEWDGRALAVDSDAESRVPLVSSSFDESAVGAARRAEYARLVPGEPTLERLLAFHRSTRGGPGPYSVAMERPEAATRSLTHVRVSPSTARQEYRPGRPDLEAPVTSAELARAPGLVTPARAGDA